MESSFAAGLGPEFRAGDWLVRPGECRIASPAGELRLRPMLMDLLVLLAERAGEVVSQNDIRDRLWKSQFVSESALTSDIADLRRLLGDSRANPRYIETVAKRGYRFIARVETRRRWTMPRLAVLIFENLTGDPEQDYFAEGMSDALITELGNISSLQVISRQSVLRFKNTKRSLPEIARELKADAIIEGSAIHVGNRARISAQLVQAEPERHLWAQSYECEMNDVLAMQGRIARSVAEAIQLALTPKELTRLSRSRPANPDAHLAYLKARYHSGTWTREGAEKTLRHLHDSIQADAEFAPAHATLSFCMIIMGYWGHLPPHEAYSKARRAALQALALDESLSEAHTAMGLVDWLADWNPAACEREIRRAIELQPSSEFAHFADSLFLVTMQRDRDRALRAARLALDLDPLSLYTNFSAAFHFVFAGEYEQAIDQAVKTIELHPDSSLAHQALAWAYIGLSNYSAAVCSFQRAVDISPDVFPLASLAHALARSGRIVPAEALLRKLRERATREYVPDVCFAVAYAGTGEADRAFEHLERCYEERDSRLYWLPVVPGFSPLRGDPRFGDLLRRIGVAGSSNLTTRDVNR